VTAVIDELYLQREQRSVDDVYLEVLLRVEEANDGQTEEVLERLGGQLSTTVYSNWMPK